MPFSYISIDYKTVYISLAAVLCLAAVWILLNRVGGKRVLVLMSAGLLCLGLVADGLSNINCVKLAVVGAEMPCVVLVKNGKGAVIGLCEENRLATANCLKLYNVAEVQTVVVVDGLNEGIELLDGYKVSNVVSAHDVENGGSLEVLKDVIISDAEAGFDIEYCDKYIKLIEAVTIGEAQNEECDLCIVKFPSGNVKAVKYGEIIGDAENDLSFKIFEGKDVVYCG